MKTSKYSIKNKSKINNDTNSISHLSIRNKTSNASKNECNLSNTIEGNLLTHKSNNSLSSTCNFNTENESNNLTLLTYKEVIDKLKYLFKYQTNNNKHITFEQFNIILEKSNLYKANNKSNDGCKTAFNKEYAKLLYTSISSFSANICGYDNNSNYNKVNKDTSSTSNDITFDMFLLLLNKISEIIYTDVFIYSKEEALKLIYFNNIRKYINSEYKVHVSIKSFNVLIIEELLKSEEFVSLLEQNFSTLNECFKLYFNLNDIKHDELNKYNNLALNNKPYILKTVITKYIDSMFSLNDYWGVNILDIIEVVLNHSDHIRNTFLKYIDNNSSRSFSFLYANSNPCKGDNTNNYDCNKDEYKEYTGYKGNERNDFSIYHLIALNIILIYLKINNISSIDVLLDHDALLKAYITEFNDIINKMKIKTNLSSDYINSNNNFNIHIKNINSSKSCIKTNKKELNFELKQYVELLANELIKLYKSNKSYKNNAYSYDKGNNTNSFRRDDPNISAINTHNSKLLYNIDILFNVFKMYLIREENTDTRISKYSLINFLTYNNICMNLDSHNNSNHNHLKINNKKSFDEGNCSNSYKNDYEMYIAENYLNKSSKFSFNHFIEIILIIIIYSNKNYLINITKYTNDIQAINTNTVLDINHISINPKDINTEISRLQILFDSFMKLFLFPFILNNNDNKTSNYRSKNENKVAETIIQLILFKEIALNNNGFNYYFNSCNRYDIILTDTLINNIFPCFSKSAFNDFQGILNLLYYSFSPLTLDNCLKFFKVIGIFPNFITYKTIAAVFNSYLSEFDEEILVTSQEFDKAVLNNVNVKGNKGVKGNRVNSTMNIGDFRKMLIFIIDNYSIGFINIEKINKKYLGCENRSNRKNDTQGYLLSTSTIEKKSKENSLAKDNNNSKYNENQYQTVYDYKKYKYMIQNSECLVERNNNDINDYHYNQVKDIKDSQINKKKGTKTEMKEIIEEKKLLRTNYNITTCSNEEICILNNNRNSNRENEFNHCYRENTSKNSGKPNSNNTYKNDNKIQDLRIITDDHILLLLLEKLLYFFQNLMRIESFQCFLKTKNHYLLSKINNFIFLISKKSNQ